MLFVSPVQIKERETERERRSSRLNLSLKFYVLEPLGSRAIRFEWNIQWNASAPGNVSLQSSQIEQAVAGGVVEEVSLKNIHTQVRYL